MMMGIELNVALFPKTGCAQDFATVNLRWLVGILNLTGAQHVHIVHQTSSLIKLRCNDWKTKRHILSYDTRTTTSRQFSIIIKDDLLAHERRQKHRMWSTMQALFKAGLRPSWRRAAITWRENDTWYYIYPGEIPEHLPLESIVAFAKNPNQPLPTPSTADTHAQTDTIPTSTRMEANLLIATQQEVAAAKRRGAMKTVECCMLRRKLKAAQLKLSTPSPMQIDSTTHTPTVDQPEVGTCHRQSAVTNHDPSSVANIEDDTAADTEDKLCQTIEDNCDAEGMHIDSNLVKHVATVELGIQTDEADAYAHMMATMKEHVSEATVKCELEINANHQLYAKSIALQQQQYAMQQQQYATLKHQYDEVVEANAQQFAAFTQMHDNLKKHTSEVVKQNRDLQKEVDLLTAQLVNSKQTVRK